MFNVDTRFRSDTVTDKYGNYQILQLPIGRYQATAEREGFRRSVSSIERLEINSSLRFDTQLELGPVSETIEVKIQVVGVETVVPTLGQSVTNQAIENLPLNGRNVLDLALLQPGVTPGSPALRVPALSASRAQRSTRSHSCSMAALITIF